MRKMFRKLRGRMEEFDITIAEMAEEMKVSANYLSKRFNGHIPFTIVDVYVICSMLKIDHNEITQYFPEQESMVAAHVKPV